MSNLEYSCISLIIAKHLEPNSVFFNTKENSNKDLIEIQELWDIVQKFIENEIFTQVSSKGRSIHFLSGDWFRSSSLKKIKPINYFIEEFFNKPPSHLFEENFEVFVYEILKKLLESYPMHNDFVGNLISGLLKNNSKRLLSIDSSYILSFLNKSKELYAGDGYSPNYPNDLVAYMAYFGKIKIRWTNIFQENGAFIIKEKYDIIYSRIDSNNLIFAEMGNSYYDYTKEEDYYTKKEDIFNDMVLQVYNSLNENGQAIFFVENKFLFENVSRVKKIVDMSFLSGAISLKNFTVLLLMKNSKSVNIFNGSDYVNEFINTDDHINYSSLPETNKIFNYKSLIEDFKNPNHKNFKTVSVRDLRSPSYDYCIQPSFIFSVLPAGTPLSECVEILKTKNYSYNEITNKKGIIKIRDLSKDASRLIVDNDHENHSTVQKYQEINQSALLLAKIGNKLRPTIFEFEGNPIYLHQNVVALIPNTKKTSIAFLAMSISNAEKRNDFSNLHRGLTIPYLTHEDILHKIKIDLPKLEIQKNELEKQLFNQIQSLKDQAKKEQIKYDQELIEAFEEIDHRIKNDLKRIKSSTNKIQDFFKDNSQLEKKVNLSWAKYYNKKEEISKPLDNIKSNITNATKLLNNLRNKKSFLDTKDYPVKDITIYKLLTHFREKVNDSNSSDYLLKLYYNNEEHKDVVVKRNDKENIAIRANIVQLDYLVGELITNAEKYAGFSNSKKGIIAMRFSYLQDESKLKLVVENNGKPFNQGFDTMEAFAKNKNTSNKNSQGGFGGGMVKRIADRYFIESDLVSNPNEEFSVKFIFKFQIHHLD